MLDQSILQQVKGIFQALEDTFYLLENALI